MKKVGSPKLLFENLDLTPLQSILWKNLHTQGPGRPVQYNPIWDLRALMIRQLEQIPYVKDMVKHLRREKSLKEACGYRDKTPTKAHFTQMKKRIGVEGFRHIEAWLRREALRLRASQPLSSTGRARETRLMQVLVNLVKMPKFSDEEGTIRITGTIEEDTVCFSVIDDGHGLTKEDLSNFFQVVSRDIC